MAKARNIYGVGNIATLPRSRTGQQRLARLLQPGTVPIATPGFPSNATRRQIANAMSGMPPIASPTPAMCPCQAMPAPPQVSAPMPASSPAGVQLSAEVPFVTMMPLSTILAQLSTNGQATIDAVDGSGRSARLVTTSWPREDNVIEAWDQGRSFATNVALGNLG